MTPWVTRLLVANVAMFLVSYAAPGVYAILAFQPTRLLQHPWSPFTYMFLHGGLFHLLFNMMALYFFGPRLEARLGGRRFITLYVVSGLFSALLSMTFSRAGLIGASGAVFGVSLGFARYWPDTPVLLMFIPMRARTMVVVLAAASLYLGFSGMMPGIAHFGHLGGFLGGWLYIRWIETRSGAAAFRRASAPRASTARSEALDRWRRIDRGGLHPVNAEELDRVFAKLDAAGPDSLTADERAFLDRLSTG